MDNICKDDVVIHRFVELIRKAMNRARYSAFM